MHCHLIIYRHISFTVVLHALHLTIPTLYGYPRHLHSIRAFIRFHTLIPYAPVLHSYSISLSLHTLTISNAHPPHHHPEYVYISFHRAPSALSPAPHATAHPPSSHSHLTPPHFLRALARIPHTALPPPSHSHPTPPHPRVTLYPLHEQQSIL